MKVNPYTSWAARQRTATIFGSSFNPNSKQTMNYTPRLFHDRKDLNNVSKELRDAAKLINDAISFGESTNQGDVKWSQICQRLQDYANEAARLHTATTPNNSGQILINPVKPPIGTAPVAVLITHAMQLGGALCGTVKGTPSQWPVGHYRFVPGSADRVTCVECIAKLFVLGSSKP